MRHEYAGDIGDYVKYALLRAICAAMPQIRLGVVWYLTDHTEHGNDGRLRPHLTGSGWEALDPQLLTELRQLSTLPGGITLEGIQQSTVLPVGTVFVSEPMPEPRVPASARPQARAAWFDRTVQAVAQCDLVFLDPDNGLEVTSVPAKAPRAGKYATASEVAALLSARAGVILYQHGARTTWPVQRDRVLSRLADAHNGALAVRTLRLRAQGGGRSFLCLSTRPDQARAYDTAFAALTTRVATWGRSARLETGVADFGPSRADRPQGPATAAASAWPTRRQRPGGSNGQT
jgi:hypothetical protein